MSPVDCPVAMVVVRMVGSLRLLVKARAASK